MAGVGLTHLNVMNIRNNSKLDFKTAPPLGRKANCLVLSWGTARELWVSSNKELFWNHAWLKIHPFMKAEEFFSCKSTVYIYIYMYKINLNRESKFSY